MSKKQVDLTSKEILNTREAAALLKVTTQTIKNYIYSGKLQAIKTPGGHHRIKRVDLKNLGFVVEEEKEHKSMSIDELWGAYNDLVGTLVATVESLIKAMDSRDIVSSGHSSRVADVACKLGKQMGLSDTELHQLRLSSLLHDVGKVGISEVILGKPGRLTDQEFFLVKKHSEIGENIISEIEHLKHISPTIRHHHERYDGKGYPDEISGTDIELNSRIIAVADTYDFLRSNLSFRKALSQEAAMQEVINASGSQFDPDIVKYFVDSARGNSLHMH